MCYDITIIIYLFITDYNYTLLTNNFLINLFTDHNSLTKQYSIPNAKPPYPPPGTNTFDSNYFNSHFFKSY